MCDWLIMIWGMTNDFQKWDLKVRIFVRDFNAIHEVINQFFLGSKSILPQVIPSTLCHLAFRLSISSLKRNEKKIFQFPVKTFVSSVRCGTLSTWSLKRISKLWVPLKDQMAYLTLVFSTFCTTWEVVLKDDKKKFSLVFSWSSNFLSI